MEGIPFAFRGPFLPTTHDAAIFAWDVLPFPHGVWELWLGDKGYVGCAHMLHEFKKKNKKKKKPNPKGRTTEEDSPSDDSDEPLRDSDPDEGYDNTDSALPIGQQLINKKIRRPRAYIEHVFAEMKNECDSFEMCKRRPEMLTNLVKFYVDSEYVLITKGLRVARYQHLCIERPPTKVNWDLMNDESCECSTNRNAKKKSIAHMKKIRSELLTTPTTPRTIPRPEQLGTKRRKIVEAPLPPLLQPTQPTRNHIAHERIIEIDRLLHEHSQN